jgi:hypothetical protein
MVGNVIPGPPNIGDLEDTYPSTCLTVDLVVWRPGGNHMVALGDWQETTMIRHAPTCTRPDMFVSPGSN